MLWIVAGIALFCAREGSAQWIRQDIPLRAGWNAVFLRVQPYPSDCDSLFSEERLDIERVHAFDHSYSSVQFITATNELILTDAFWMRWFPPGSDQRSFRTLHQLHGGRVYFIKRLQTASNLTWTVQGEPRLNEIDWRSDTLNLVGFELDTTSPPTFDRFFGGSSAHSNQPIYRMNPQGKWVRVLNLLEEQMQSGEAFWIQMDQYDAYQGPVRLEIDHRSGLDFGTDIPEEELRIHNDSPFPKQIQIRTRSSEPSPVGEDHPAVAGDVPLLYWDWDPPTSTNGWVPLTQPITKTLEAGEEWRVRLAVRRNELTPGNGPTEAIYQSLLQISDDERLSTYTVGVRAQADRMQGLWVGSALITHVSQPSSLVAPTNPLPTNVEFPLRLILHVDTNQQVRLLDEVIQMWKEGSYTTNQAELKIDNEWVKTVDEPGRYVWITDDTLLSQFSGSALRDGESVGRRISSIAFGLDRPQLMNGTSSSTFGTSGTQISCIMTQRFDHPLNPFLHRYHPDHNNKTDRGEALPDGEESFTIVREIRMIFEDLRDVGLLESGDRKIGGVWEEQIDGLRHQTIHSKGSFRLHRLSEVGVLNDGL